MFSAHQANKPSPVLPRRPGALVFMLGSLKPWALILLLLTTCLSLCGEQARDRLPVHLELIGSWEGPPSTR